MSARPVEIAQHGKLFLQRSVFKAVIERRVKQFFAFEAQLMFIDYGFYCQRGLVMSRPKQVNGKSFPIFVPHGFPVAFYGF